MATPATMAPEVLKKQYYSKKADLWSLGVISFQLLYNQLPFRAKKQDELLNVILNSKLKFPETNKISSSLEHLLTNLLQKDPNSRYAGKDFFVVIIYIGLYSFYKTAWQ